MFKSATLARATGLLNLAAALSSAGAREFAPCGPTQPSSYGFVPPREKSGALIEVVAGQWIMAVKIETKSVPAAEVKKHLELRLDAVEKETGRRPKGKRSREIKDEVIQDLLPKAFAKDKRMLVWIDPADGLVLIDSTSTSQVDLVLALLCEILYDTKLTLINSAMSPTTAMSGWLVGREGPPDFSIDRECELKQPDGEKAVVRYSRHTLDIDEVVDHIKQGKQPTRLAMTWCGRLSFVLTDALQLKKIQLLDVALEAKAGDEARDAFDADVTIATGEIGMAIGDLLTALGGEIQQPAQA